MKRFCLLLASASCLGFSSFVTEPISKKLQLSYLNLKTIELDSAQAANLIEVDLSGNLIKTLPGSLRYAKDLKILKLNSCKNIDWNQLVNLLKGLQIEEIHMDFCNLTYIPLEFAELKSLRKISMSNNELSDLPWNLLLNTKLEYLNFEHNEIVEIGKEISYPQELRYLNLSDNPCINNVVFWKQLPSLTNLEILLLNGCTKIPATVTLPPQLKELYLNDCKAPLPINMGNTSDLKMISLLNYGVNVSDLESLLAPFVGKTKVRELRFSSMYISKISTAILAFPELEKLSIECGSLKEVCDLGLLKNLKNLSIKSSDTNAVGLLLQSLINSPIAELNLQNTDYKKLPATIGQLRSLKQLNLENCQATNILSVLAPLDSLREADLRGCSYLDTAGITKYRKKHPNTILYYNASFVPATTYVPTAVAKNNFVRKPFPDLHLPEQQFLVSNKKDTVLTANDGSHIQIPANSIVDASGKAVKGPVKISYQTYKTPEEVFASGLPMQADSAGQKFDFASAGMFSLNAFQSNGKKAFLAKGKEISVDFTSAYPNQSYNYYYLDTAQKNWVQTGADNIKSDKKIKPKPKKEETKKPINPDKVAYGTIHIKTHTSKPRKQKPKFEIYHTMKNNARTADTVLYDPKEISALKEFEWEYTGTNNKDFFDAVNKLSFFTGLQKQRRRWFQKADNFIANTQEGVEFSLRADKQNDCYNLVFSTNTDSVVIPAIPVINENNAAKIQKINKELYDNYADLHKENKSQRSVRFADFVGEYNRYERRMYAYHFVVNAYHNSFLSYEEYMNIYNDYTITHVDSMASLEVTNENVVRSLTLTGFGTYNCDYFTRPENWIVSNPKFIDKSTGQRFNPKEVTLIDLASNAYITGAQGKLRLAKNKSYWIFTTNDKGAIGFTSISTGTSEFEKIEVKEIQAKSIKELRDQLKY